MKVVFKKGSVNQEFVISWVRYIKVRLYMMAVSGNYLKKQMMKVRKIFSKMK